MQYWHPGMRLFSESKPPLLSDAGGTFWGRLTRGSARAYSKTISNVSKNAQSAEYLILHDQVLTACLDVHLTSGKHTKCAMGAEHSLNRAKISQIKKRPSQGRWLGRLGGSADQTAPTDFSSYARPRCLQ